MKIFRLTVLFIPVISKDTGPPATGFRSIDGIGNNIENPKLGSYNYPYSRYNSYAEYGDGISSPSGANRPNAKVISNLLFGAEPSNLNAEPVSDFLPFWGQFIAHDVALTQENATETMPVVVNTCDFVDLDVECSGSIQYNVSRALRDKQDNEESALNFATGFIDGSVIYGSNQETNDILRTFENGFLRTFIDPVSGSELLPIANATTFGMMASARVTAKTKLFLAGDKRANVHPALQAIHTLFVREHNRYARELYEKNKGNSTFTDGYIYERARAWVIALIQKITYSQYYPGLIGQALPAYTGYKDDVDPTPQTDFIGAAYRYGHSAVSGTILRLDENGQQVPDGHLLLRDHFFNTDGILSTNGDL
ncbi:heme peroxidase, partial [Globomyces pollinis-pini]